MRKVPGADPTIFLTWLSNQRSYMTYSGLEKKLNKVKTFGYSLKDRQLLIGRPLRRCRFLSSYNSQTHILYIKLKGIFNDI